MITYVVAFLSFQENTLLQKVMHYSEVPTWKQLALDSGYLGNATDSHIKSWLDECFPNEWDEEVCGIEFFNCDMQWSFIKV